MASVLIEGWRFSWARRWWTTSLILTALMFTYANTQDISMCCTKADGTCRSVCEKMSLVANTDNDMHEERIKNIYKFCTPSPQLVDFWICMNNTIEEVVEEVGWWGRACCELGNSPGCREACSGAQNEQALVTSAACRHSDEIAFFDCVHSQRAAQWCCSQTQYLNCHEACHKALWKIGNARIDTAALERALDVCEQSPPLLRCLRNMTASSVHTDTSKYLPCCHESSRTSCRSACEAVLRRTGEPNEISDTLTAACGAPSLSDGLWQCFLRKDEPTDNKDIIPHDVAKLHCCQKAKTTNCRKLCFETFNTGWQNNWQKFYSDCLGDPQENDLTECIEEVEAPCSLGCAGLTYCSQLNNRPTTLFRSCTAQADLEAHLAVAEQKGSRSITVSGLVVPLKNLSQCPTDIWKSVACPLHVKPCTAKGHSSLLCAEECTRLVSECIEWSRAAPQLSAAALCARLTPRDPTAPCVQLSQYTAPSPEPPLLSAREAVTSPCAGSPCNATQICVPNRSCLHSNCKRYTCLDGCRIGEGSAYVVSMGSWVRVPMASGSRKACFKVCRCGPRGLANCQPLPCVELENCRLHDRIVPHVNTSHCNSQPQKTVCDTDGVTHPTPCHLALGGKRLAYWGPCLKYCSQRGTVCGVNGVTYISECAAWSDFVSVDYLGPCVAVGLITDLMEPMCQFDRIECPSLKKNGCQGFTPPGACCPRCGGGLRILYSKKQIDRALYGTNISATVINLHNLLKALERHVKIAECALRGYLTIESEIFVSVETLLDNPTDLQLEVCVLEAEKIADMINRESALISVDLGLSALSYALTVHTYATKAVSCVTASILTVMLANFSIYVLR
ncbi:hypothetical protein evm_009844 [Chilo suppressalis]|nr:hypothetical protein evm_009844 [Chilo suppressalis]